MNHEENIAQTKIEIEQAKRNLAELKRRYREEQKAETRKSRKLSGRKQLPTALIERAKELAKTKTLVDVALRLGISLRSLYNKGISRKAINAELDARQTRTDRHN